MEVHRESLEGQGTQLVRDDVGRGPAARVARVMKSTPVASSARLKPFTVSARMPLREVESFRGHLGAHRSGDGEGAPMARGAWPRGCHRCSPCPHATRHQCGPRAAPRR